MYTMLIRTIILERQMDVKVSPDFVDSQHNYWHHLQNDANNYLHLTNNSYVTSHETNKLQQTIDGSKVTINNNQPINGTFKSWSPITTQQNWPIKNHNQRHKCHHLTKALHLTLKMTNTRVFEMSVTFNSLSEDHSHLDNHTSDSVWKVEEKQSKIFETVQHTMIVAGFA